MSACEHHSLKPNIFEYSLKVWDVTVLIWSLRMTHIILDEQSFVGWREQEQSDVSDVTKRAFDPEEWSEKLSEGESNVSQNGAIWLAEAMLHPATWIFSWFAIDYHYYW